MKSTIFSIVFAVLVSLGVGVILHKSFNSVVAGLTKSPPQMLAQASRK